MFLCGNGGSAANAIHLANDLLYGILKQPGSGLRVHALPANTSVISCLANDEGYEHIFALQLAVQARQGDVLIALSGSAAGTRPTSSGRLRKRAASGCEATRSLVIRAGSQRGSPMLQSTFRWTICRLPRICSLLWGTWL